MRKIKAIAVALALVLGAGVFTGCASVIKYEKYADANLYVVGGASFDANEITKVEIDWLGGSVEIDQSADTVEIAEDKGSEKEEERMRYYLDDTVLKIKYCQSGLRANIAEQYKHLQVSVPKGVDLEVDCTSAKVEVGVLEVRNFSVESVSGNVEIERVECNEASVETVSGKVSVASLKAVELEVETTSGAVSVAELNADWLSAETTSGDLSFGLQKAIRSKEALESSSGDITFILAGDLSATIRLDTASGKLTSDKPFTKDGLRYQFGASSAEGCNIEIETFSANVIVK